MADMVLKNSAIYQIYQTEEKRFVNADIKIEDGRFAAINYIDDGKADEIDKTGEVIIPGFIDIHSHGAAGVDMFTSECGKLAEMSEFYARNGVTTLFPTSMSENHDNIMRMIEEVKKARKNAKINFAGIHIEGPYINTNRRGVHDPNLIRSPKLNELDEIAAAVLDCGLKLHITVAPEIEGAGEFILAAVQKGATITMGHTEADSETLGKAIGYGANSFTHLFNAMSPIHHRDAGVAGYALVKDTYVEIICDGIHLCPDVVNLVSKAKDDDRIIIVSDSMSAAGLPEGEYNLGTSRDVIVENGRAFIRNADGTETIAGSTANLCSELNNFMIFTGRDLAASLWTVTKNPASLVGIYDRKGEIAVGKDADFIVWDRNNNKIKSVYVGGKIVV